MTVRAVYAARTLPQMRPYSEYLPVEAPPPLTSEELQWIWDRGNKRRPLPPNRADNTKANIVDGTRRWSAFCEALPGKPAWKPLVKTLSWDNRGLAEAFARFLMRRENSRIGALSTICLYLRQLSAIYRKYTGETLELRLRDHFVAIAKAEHARLFGLRREPKHKKALDPSGFTYLAHFCWVRDKKSKFKIGLDRLDDSLIRDILMWTGCRRHELKPDPYVQPRPKDCWVCGGLDERTEAQYKVLCWEDIDLWILRDPMRNGGRDYLAMQILLHFHKGENKEIVPTWFPFVEEKLPILCPISKLLAKARAEGVIDLTGYDTCTEPFFNTKLSMPAVHIPWKKEFWHKPVFRKTVESVEGPIKQQASLVDSNPTTIGEGTWKSSIFDENAPMGVSDEEMRIIGPDSTIRRLEREWSALEGTLKEKYGDSTKATGDDAKMRKRKSNELRAARQRWRRKAGDLLRKDHFKKRNRTELDRQLRGIHEPQQPLQKVIFSLPERRHLAEILGDLDEDLPEIEIVRRKIDAIDAWVNYAWKIEPKELTPS
ncbi:hypothetical protein F5883DRAFT_697821 [Diaporthe sp. PMI_573]|nr:hypothetical protein F5883DRAFT_697821 [Diaporthaceae sp. PMI_573]